MNVPSPTVSLRRTTRPLLLAALMGAVSLTACGDETIVAVGGGPAADTQTGADGDAASDTPENPATMERELIVLHDTTAPLALSVTETRQLRVRLVDYGRSGPASDVRVDFRIIESPDGGTASLASQQVYTDDAGIASVAFRSGTAADMAYTVEVRATNAASVQFPVFVSDAPRGSVRVRLQYEGPIAIKNIHIRLVPGVYTCGQFNAVRPPLDLLAETTLLGLGAGDAVWHNLPEGQRFTVFATADSQQDRLASAGCLDGVVVLPNQENTVTLNLFLLSLNAAGLYDSVSVFDFTGAIPGTVGQVIDELSLLFNSPGMFLINQIKRIAALYVGEFITNAVFGLFEDTVADVINDWMFNRSPGWIQDILTVGQDLLQVVNRLEMLANLQITKLTGDFHIQGAMRWHGLALYWRRGCAREGQPGYDPECGRNAFTMNDIENTQFPLNLVEGRFTASIQDFDRLAIDNHSVRLNYGRLVIFVLNEMILRNLTGHGNLRDAVQSFVNCEALADRIYFSALSTIGVTRENIAGFCSGAIDVIITPLTMILDALALDTSIRLSGTAVLEDLDNDLRVDRIINGQYMGHFESDGRAGAPFTGTWQAVRASGF